jgi:archaemetzincin
MSRSKTIGFAHKALLPTEDKKIRAIGFGDKKIPTEFQPNPKFFKPIPKPTNIDDWLAQYAPEIQSFDGWKKFAGRRKLLTTTKKTIYLLPIGTFDDNAPSLDALAEYCNAFYTPFVTKRLPPLGLEKKGSKYFLKTEDGDVPITWRKCHRYYDERTEDTHRQFKVADLLTYLVDHIPEDGICLLAVTMEDLYDGNTDAFTAGMAFGGNGAAIFSFSRYDPNFDARVLRSDKKKKKIVYTDVDRRTLLLRSCKIMVHEIGHMFGMDHCSYYACIMNGSGHLLEDFAQPIHLCPVCLHKVTTLTGATVKQTYDMLLTFYNKHTAKEESKWISERLKNFTNDTDTILVDEDPSDNNINTKDNNKVDNSRKRKRDETKMTIQLEVIDVADDTETRASKRPRRTTAKYN